MGNKKVKNQSVLTHTVLFHLQIVNDSGLELFVTFPSSGRFLNRYDIFVHSDTALHYHLSKQ